MGCLVRLGCLGVLLLAAIAGWLTKDRWWPGAQDRAVVPAWERLTPQGAERTHAALARLGRPNGPVFASLSGGDVASYVFLERAGGIAGFADSAEAAVVGDQLVVRATVPVREMRGLRDLGPLASVLNDREPVQVSGRLRVAGGRGELTVTEVKVRDFKLPNGVVTRLLGRSAAEPADGGSDAVIAVPLPPHVGDVRVADGRITLYKNVP